MLLINTCLRVPPDGAITRFLMFARLEIEVNGGLNKNPGGMADLLIGIEIESQC